MSHHIVQITNKMKGFGKKKRKVYRAECNNQNCGFQSDWYDDPNDATRVAIAHSNTAKP